LSKRTSVSSSDTDYMLHFGGGNLTWTTGNSSDSCATLAMTEPSRQEWHHLVGVLNQTTASAGSKNFYIDGKLVASCNYSTKAPANTATLSLALGYGQVDDFRLYNVAMNADQVRALYETGAQ